LKAYNEARTEFEKYNARMLAISPQVPDSSLSTAERHSLAFEVLSDAGNKVAKTYGIVYTLPGPIAAVLGETVAAYNADGSATLPLAVTYVIDTNRIIRYAFIDPDYRRRAEPDEIIKALKKI
jgi:peroxiredoxin